MKASRAKKLLKFIESKDIHKFVKYLKEKKIDVDTVLRDPESSTILGSFLHLACHNDRDDIIRYLIRMNIDALILDSDGNPAIYVALKRAVFLDCEAFTKLVEPLMKYSPEALSIINKKGRTGHELLLEWYKKEEYWEMNKDSDVSDELVGEADDWSRKIHDEAESEYEHVWGVYENDFCERDRQPETANDWFEKIGREYRRKRQAPAFDPCAAKRARREKDEQSAREFTQRLERQHQQYVNRMSEIREERLAKNRHLKYAEGWTNIKAKDKLIYDDIPWPDLKNLEYFLLGKSDRKDTRLCRKLLREEQIRWHPDKFAQKFGAKIVDDDQTKVREKVKVISQEINVLIEKFSDV